MSNQHIVRRGSDWAIRKEGAERDTQRFDTQAQAIKAGQKIAENQGSELFIHGRNGKFRERNSHGHDPFPPKG